MELQDAASAAARYARLQQEAAKARRLLSFNPASGKPARFLDATSGWGRLQAAEAREMALKLGQPDLRELVLNHHILLYAHSATEVSLLSMRHERQARYPLSL